MKMEKTNNEYYAIYSDELYIGLKCEKRYSGEYDAHYNYNPGSISTEHLVNWMKFYPHEITQRDFDDWLPSMYRNKYITIEQLNEEFKDWEISEGARNIFITKGGIILTFDYYSYELTVDFDLRSDVKPIFYYGRCRSLNDLKRIRERYNF